MTVMSTMRKWEMLAFGPGVHKGMSMTRPNPTRMEVALQLLHFLLIFSSNEVCLALTYLAFC